MMFRRIELLLYCVLAAFCVSLCQGQLQKAEAAKLESLQKAWVNTEEQPYYKMEKNDIESIVLSGGDTDPNEVTTSNNAEFVFRQTEEDPGFYGTVSSTGNDINAAIVFDVLMEDGDVFVKMKEGVPDDAKGFWFSVNDEGLSELSKDITNSFKISEVGDNLDANHVSSIVELDEVIDGDPETTVCYEITPTEAFEASKASDTNFQVDYTSTYCMDTEKNLLTRTNFNLTESSALELDSGKPGQLNVEANTAIKFSDFGVKIDFPELDLSKFEANQETAEVLGKSGAPGGSSGTPGAPGAPGAGKESEKEKDHDFGLGAGEPGDNSAFRKDKIAFIFVGLSMLAFM